MKKVNMSKVNELNQGEPTNLTPKPSQKSPILLGAFIWKFAVGTGLLYLIYTFLLFTILPTLVKAPQTPCTGENCKPFEPRFQDTSQFGESYGALNALFSGLAFAAVALSLYLQRKDLETTLSEIHRSVTAQNVQAESAEKNQYLQGFLYLHGYLSSDEFTKARHNIRTEPKSKNYEDWTENDKEAANKVCVSYDQAGILIYAGLLGKDNNNLFLKSSWGESVCHQYELLAVYLNNIQAPGRTGMSFFEHFVWLYEQAKSARKQP